MKYKFLSVVLSVTNLAFAGNIDLGFSSSTPSAIASPTTQANDSLPVTQANPTTNSPIQNTSPVISKEDAFLIRQVNSGLPSTAYSSKTDIPDYYVVVNRNIKPIVSQPTPSQSQTEKVTSQPQPLVLSSPTSTQKPQQVVSQETVKTSKLQQQDKVVISNNTTSTSKTITIPQNGITPTPKTPYTFKAIPDDSMKPQIVYSN